MTVPTLLLLSSAGAFTVAATAEPLSISALPPAQLPSIWNIRSADPKILIPNSVVNLQPNSDICAEPLLTAKTPAAVDPGMPKLKTGGNKFDPMAKPSMRVCRH